MTNVFFLNSFLLGVGLAMDAFSVSMANGLHEPGMSKRKELCIASTFGIFQQLMPLIGWFCVHTIVEKFRSFEPFIPWIALGLLGYIGGKMLIEGLKGGCEDESCGTLTFGTLMVQGVATAIDALSVGFTIAEYSFMPALVCTLIINAVTFALSLVGIKIGKRFGVMLSNKASILGGAILILIGLEIWFTGVF